MSAAVGSIILCEGYHDRAFLQGALLKIGCTDPGEGPNGSRRPIQDPAGHTIRGGTFAFESQSKRFISVRPCRGKNNIQPELQRLLKEWQTKQYQRVVACIDSDGDARAETSRPSVPAWVDDAVKKVDGSAVKSSTGDLQAFGGRLTVSAMTWSADDAHTVELPWKQTLERMIVAAIRDAYPKRSDAVAAWLTTLPDSGRDGPKEHAWSHMAGWYAEKGCEGFCRFVWDDPGVAEGLRRRLESCGSWRILDELAR